MIYQKSILFNIVWKWDYEELPSVFKRYITLRASGRAATQLVTNSAGKLLGTQEAQARAACMGGTNATKGHNLWYTDGTSYRPYQPYRLLHDERCITILPELSGWFE